eukprot:9421276-Alexandrium_andersonii.AAC.1
MPEVCSGRPKKARKLPRALRRPPELCGALGTCHGSLGPPGAFKRCTVFFLGWAYRPYLLDPTALCNCNFRQLCATVCAFRRSQPLAESA